MSHVWYKIFLKTVTLTVFALAILVIGMSSFTLIGVFQSGEKAPKHEKEAHWSDHFIPKFGEIKGEYRKAVIGCVITAIIAGFIQLISSVMVIFSCGKDSGRKQVKSWLIANLLVFIILIVCFVIPLVYEENEGDKAKDINKHLDRFKGKTVWENLVHELNGYYAIVGINEGVLLIFLVLICSCYCMKCGDDSYLPLP